jgi:hypothetical protein
MKKNLITFHRQGWMPAEKGILPPASRTGSKIKHTFFGF